MKKISRDCLFCNKQFFVWECKLKHGRGKYCSRTCFISGSKGRLPWNTGKTKQYFPQLSKPKSLETRQKISKALKGKQNCLGRVVSVETRAKISLAHKGMKKPWSKGPDPLKITGVKNHWWKGDKVSYRTLHKWVERHKGRLNKCEMCSKEIDGRMHWANTDHKYSRNLEDWLRLCPACHGKYDKQHNLRHSK